MNDNVVAHADICARDRIVAAARVLFATNGFHQTAMADLAREARVSVGAIYRSYASKADIINAIILSDTANVFGELERAYGDLLAGRLTIEEALQKIILGQCYKNEGALSHEIMAEAHRNPDVACTIESFCLRFREIFRSIADIANPDLTPEELDGAEEVLLACMFGLAHRNLAGPQLDDMATAAIATKLLLQAVGYKPQKME